MAFVIGVYVVAVIMQTLLLAGTLHMLQSAHASSVKTDGAKLAWAKCLGLSLTIWLVVLIPGAAMIVLVVWFLGTAALFHLTIVKAFALFLINAALSCPAVWVLSEIFGLAVAV